MPTLRITRPFAAALIALAAAVASPLAISAEPLAAPATTPGVYRMQLGDFKIVALADGTLHLSPTQLLVEDRPGAVKSLLAKAGQADMALLPMSVNAFLIDTGEKRVLVDTGAGTLFGPDTGKLLDHLRAAGYTPGQIDEILITHLHPDHCGGLSRDGKAVFANALVRVDERDAAYWLDRAHQAEVDDSAKGSFDSAIAALQPYRDSGHFKTFAPGATLAPGIRALDTAGHTPGHSVYRIESRGQTLLAWGDVLHFQSVQFADPKVTIHFDSTPAAAEAAREKILREAAASGEWIAGAHLAFPGIGHVVKAGTAYAWQPVGKAD